MQSVDITTPKPWIFTFTMNYAIYSVKNYSNSKQKQEDFMIF